MFAFAMICGIATDKIIKEKHFGLSTTSVRKIMNTVGLLGPGIGFIGLSFSKCNQVMAIFWLCVSVMLNGANYSGFGVSNREQKQFENWNDVNAFNR